MNYKTTAWFLRMIGTAVSVCLNDLVEPFPTNTSAQYNGVSYYDPHRVGPGMEGTLTSPDDVTHRPTAIITVSKWDGYMAKFKVDFSYTATTYRSVGMER